MTSDWWNKIKKLFDPMADTPPAAPADNIEDVRDHLVELLMRSLKRFRGKDDFIGITLWIDDASYEVLNDKEFINRLRVAFDNASFYSLGSGKILLKQGRPEEDAVATELEKDVYWFSYAADGVRLTPAVLTIRDGEGSFEGQSACTLDPGEKDRWHLGRGRISRKDGIFRQNDVVIDGNDYVSSSHLDILIRDEKYYVKVMPSGCRPAGGSPTKIVRGDAVNELTDTHALYPLQDGDFLDLGKSLLIEFNRK